MLEEAGHWRWALRVFSLVHLLLCYLLSANGEAVTSQLSAPAVSVEVEGRDQGYRSTAQGSLFFSESSKELNAQK